LDIRYLQPVMEAFDDDGSGFITVSEVNMFIDRRPENWSFLKWVAYWAIGANMASVQHCDNILCHLGAIKYWMAKMDLENQAFFGTYLHELWQPLETLVASLEVWDGPRSLLGVFTDYAHDEDKWIRDRLAKIKYVIDSQDTITLILGSRAIEKSLFRLLDVLLENHLNLFAGACRAAGSLSVEQQAAIQDSTSSIQHIFDSVRERWFDLKASFRHHGFNIQDKFHRFGCGIYEYSSDPSLYWNVNQVKARYQEKLKSRNDTIDDGVVLSIHGSILCHADCQGKRLAQCRVICTMCPFSPSTYEPVSFCHRSQCFSSSKGHGGAEGHVMVKTRRLIEPSALGEIFYRAADAQKSERPYWCSQCGQNQGWTWICISEKCNHDTPFYRCMRCEEAMERMQEDHLLVSMTGKPGTKDK